MPHPDVSSHKPEGLFLVEGRQRLSKSILWKLQRNYFNQCGIQAWNEAVVPHQITSNPWIASAYAHIVFAWLRDWQTADGGKALDLTQPIYLIELGSGNGRFGYLFLNKLLWLLGRSALPDVPIKYVYTDFTDYNLDILRSHPSLQAWVERGLLDFAHFDIEEDTEIHLSESGQVLRAGTVMNPLVALANYVFDGVRQDLFRILGKELQEGLVNISSPQQEQNHEDPTLAGRAHITCDYQSVSGGPYDDPAWNGILEEYRERLSDTVLLFPCAALACLQNLRKIANDRLLLLSGDKGDVTEECLLGREQLHLAAHGSVSFMVNYHAIGRYVLGQNGQFLCTSHLHSSLKIVAALFGRPGGHGETRLTFDEFIEGRGPDDFYALRAVAEQDWEAFELRQMISYVRLSGWDHSVFLSTFPALMEKAPHASSTEAAELELMIRKVWETYFPLRETQDVAFHLGLLSMVILRFPAAIEFFQQSMDLYGPNVATVLNMAVSHSNLGQWPEALERTMQALELDPDSKAARDLEKSIETAMTAKAENRK